MKVKTRHRARWFGAGRIAALLTMIGLLLAGLSGTAMAHDELQGSSPENGATLAAAPETVELRFTAELTPEFVSATVTTADGARWDAGPAQIGGSTVFVPVQTAVPAGSYTVGYRVVSSDGHPVTGSITYQVTTDSRPAATASTTSTTAQPTTATSPPPAAENVASQNTSGGSPVWPWVVGLVILLAAGIWLAMRLGRNRG